MKTSELRLGNFILNKYGSNCVVEKITMSLISESDELYPDDDFAPIPLTEEWLLKFRFKKSDSIYFTGSSIDEPDFVIDYSDREFYYCTKEYSGYVEDYVYKCRTELHYVHQLQNLYFALKGEELTLN